MANMLVVDDEREIVRVLADYLRERGHEVWEAGSGAQALTLARHYQFDVAFLDLMMPGMDGNETLRCLKLQSPQTVVIMVSGVTDERLALQSMTLGAFDYVCKPFDLRRLESVVLHGLAMRG
jgi:DNA-binding response OmpR family regulator